MINGGVVENDVALKIRRSRRGAGVEDSGCLGGLRLRRMGRSCTEDGITDIDLLALQAKRQ